MKKSRMYIVVLAALVLSVVVLTSAKKPTVTTINFDPSTMRNVKRVSDDGIEKGWMAISRDGQKILYCEQPSEFDPTNTTLRITSRIMYLRNASVFTKTPLIESFSYAPNFYEDGNSFVYIKRSDNEDRIPQLIKSNVNGGAKIFITRNPIGEDDNHPSVRNGVIALDTRINGARQIVTVRDNGSELTILGPGSYPSWHPTENKLIFEKDRGIWEMDTETAQTTQLYGLSEKEKKDGLWVSKPVYSADGSYIIFMKTVKVGSKKPRHLFKLNVDGSNLTELITGDTDVWSPACGAGNEIFFMANMGGKSTEIWSALINVQ